MSDELPESDATTPPRISPSAPSVARATRTKPVPPRNRASSVPIPAQDGTQDGTSLRPERLRCRQPQRTRPDDARVERKVRYMMDSGESGTTKNAPALLTEQPARPAGPAGRDRARSAARPAAGRAVDHAGHPRLHARALSRCMAPQSGARRHAELPDRCASRRSVTASPVLEVGIDATGKLEKAVIRTSSGYPGARPGGAVRFSSSRARSIRSRRSWRRNTGCCDSPTNGSSSAGGCERGGVLSTVP